MMEKQRYFQPEEVERARKRLNTLVTISANFWADLVQNGRRWRERKLDYESATLWVETSITAEDEQTEGKQEESGLTGVSQEDNEQEIRDFINTYVEVSKHRSEVLLANDYDVSFILGWDKKRVESNPRFTEDGRPIEVCFNSPRLGISFGGWFTGGYAELAQALKKVNSVYVQERPLINLAVCLAPYGRISVVQDGFWELELLKEFTEED